MDNGLPSDHDGDHCPVCLMPLIHGECIRHGTEEMIAWGMKYRRDMEQAHARAERLAALLRRAEAMLQGKMLARYDTDLEDDIKAALGEKP